MTVSNTASQTTVSGNGAQTVFNYGFEIAVGASWSLWLEDNLGNITLISPSAYSVSGVGTSTGGTFTYPLLGSPVPAGSTLTFQRETPNQQQTSLGNQGAYYPQVVEEALDWIVMQVQELVNNATRSLAGPPADGVALNLLPSAKLRASGVLSFDSLGQPSVVSGTLPPASVSVAMAPVLLAASLADAIALLFASAATLTEALSLTAAGTALAVTNNVTIGGTLGVAGAATVGGTLGVTGAASFAAAATVQNAAPGTQDAVPIAQADARYAPLAGLSTQTFSVANAATASEAVALAQVQNAAPGYFSNTVSGTGVSATSASFTAPSAGLLVCIASAVWSVSANGMTASTSLGGDTFSPGGGFLNPTGLLLQPMTSGQATTISLSSTAPSAGTGTVAGWYFFLPLA